MPSLLLPRTPFPREQVFGDVCGDDLAVLAMVDTSNRAFVEDQLRMDRADAMHAALGSADQKKKNVLGTAISRSPFGVLTSTASVEGLGSRCVDDTLALTTSL